MKDSSMTYDLYTPLAEHTIIDISTSPTSTDPDVHRVTVQHLITGETKQIEVSFCAILIGSRPDLRFLSNVGPLKKTEPRRTTGCLQTIKLIEDCGNEEQWSLLSRKMAWLKNLCAKCKHLNVCEWSRRNEYRKICGHNYGKTCECNRLVNQQQSLQQQTYAEDSQLYRMPNDESPAIMKLGEDPLKPIDCKSNPIAVDKYTNAVLNAPKGLYSMGPLVGDNFVRFIPGGALAITSSLYKEND